MGVENNSIEQNTNGATSEHVEALLEAARYGDIEDVISLASSGVSLDSEDSMGRRALHMAAANGHLNVVEYLISKRVDLNACNAENNTPLHWACLNGQIEVVKKLILLGANVSALNRTPMDEAVTQGKMPVIDAINEAAAEMELTNVTVS
ncbi:serine/threonine-protein phosphatase 6 regulatory ankyrin repeat subunit B isoform X2 [Tripterygium wilfordii]|uniref:serine/threonine-protein phosphatase 6 regulatory ankyrin repeat subunit B isoform X2 n=1 Tax=Tripterygium wilfordii TaxID=458696 RepID=UPI0018F81AF0|nr:serine/threonine-protein phosphatase 6 regulatory ankyrin repeat subunit B isoform X2 [Tripterygium wilfordii]